MIKSASFSLVFPANHQLSVVDDVQTENGGSNAAVDHFIHAIPSQENASDHPDDWEYYEDDEKAAAPSRDVIFSLKTKYREEESDEGREPSSDQNLRT